MSDRRVISVPIEFALRAVSDHEERVLHGKERGRSFDISGCLSALPAYQEEVPESLHALGDRDVHPHGGHRGVLAMVPGLHSAPFAIPLRSRKRGEDGEAAGRQADTQAAAGDILLRVLATLRDRSMNEDTARQP